MKAPAFWYDRKSVRGRVLAPLGHVYRVAGLLRRVRAHPYSAKVPVICVGNIVAGGAGKTPTCLALRKLLVKQDPAAKIVFVTRGYGGTEKGPLRVDPQKHTSVDVGDEALLLARAAPCWIGCDRAAVIREAEKEATHIIMDDGLQNPHVAATLNLLVIDGVAGLGNQKLIPAGPLRETLNDAFSRIRAIVMIGLDIHQIATNKGLPVLNATLLPSLSSSFMAAPKVLAFAGIGRPEKFYQSCRDAGLKIVESRDFPDHHVFSADELDTLAQSAREKNLRLITTAKDFVRLPESFRQQVSVLDITLTFERPEAVVNLVSSVIAKECVTG